MCLSNALSRRHVRHAAAEDRQEIGNLGFHAHVMARQISDRSHVARLSDHRKLFTRIQQLLHVHQRRGRAVARLRRHQRAVTRSRNMRVRQHRLGGGGAYMQHCRNPARIEQELSKCGQDSACSSRKSHLRIGCPATLHSSQWTPNRIERSARFERRRVGANCGRARTDIDEQRILLGRKRFSKLWTQIAAVRECHRQLSRCE